MRGMLRTLTEYDVCGLSQQSCLVLSDEAGEEEVDEEEEEDEEEEKEAMEKEPHLIQMRLALADISENLLTLLSCVHYRG